MDSSGISSIVVLLTVIVAAGIVASEFSQGTIKMLLSRPVKRWKIFTSKYVTVILFGIVLMLIGFVVSIVVRLSFLPIRQWARTCLEWEKLLKFRLGEWASICCFCHSVYVFVTATLAFMIGSVFRSISLAIGLSLFIYFMGSQLVMFLARYAVVKYIVFTHMDLTIL